MRDILQLRSGEELLVGPCIVVATILVSVVVVAVAVDVCCSCFMLMPLLLLNRIM